MQAINPANRVDKKRLRKSSSINSMYISTTISKPCVDSIINGVATIMNSQILEDLSQGEEIATESDLFFFSEEKYFLEKPDAFDQ